MCAVGGGCVLSSLDSAWRWLLAATAGLQRHGLDIPGELIIPDAHVDAASPKPTNINVDFGMVVADKETLSPKDFGKILGEEEM